MENQEKKDYTVEELEQMLNERKQAQDAERQAEREAYEKERDLFVQRSMVEAIAFSQILTEFKNDMHRSFKEYEERLNSYGGLRGNSKGGFSLTTTDGKYRIRRTRATSPEWDERSKKGETLIIEFLKEQITDEKIHKLVMSFLERNDKGELEYSRVMNLLNMKNDFQDERWITGLELMQESYSKTLRAYGYEFLKKDEETGKWNRVEINFTAI
ncbi:MAG TPA: DUF3164 family protein [Crocinitomicaceae bacterium]|nr:DUF3164 family protein [Crocinitomicaceae bacterium]